MQSYYFHYKFNIYIKCNLIIINIRSLDEVSSEVVELFSPVAERIIEERGAVEALSMALAVMSGAANMKSRSLLTSAEGYRTYIFKTTTEMHGLGYVWQALAKCIDNEIKETIKGMKFIADKTVSNLLNIIFK